ncbi:MAG: helix-turn-helix domain-containing protein [Thermomicrobiales bacterium]|jgi:hypothetical protein
MSNKQHVVRLTAAERTELRQLIETGSAHARRLKRARILLKADASIAGPRWTDVQIAEALECSPRTVARLRERCCREGLAASLGRRPSTRVYRRRFDGAAEARLTTLACSPAPAGAARWTLRLLADTVVEQEIVPQVCPETVRMTLKKTSSSRG